MTYVYKYIYGLFSLITIDIFMTWLLLLHVLFLINHNNLYRTDKIKFRRRL